MSNILYLNSPARSWLQLARDRRAMVEFYLKQRDDRQAQVWLDMTREAVAQAMLCAAENHHPYRHLPSPLDAGQGGRDAA